MHQALYRKWRPRTFDEVCGQEHITSILKQEAMEGSFNHAYLFCGSRGTGKTTCAKILSRVVNCESPIGGNPCGKCPSCLAIESGATTDVLEMDAASNNGVDNIRDIRDEVVYSPSLLKYRVYIVDEVHMLSSSAFNALLKTLEEPPQHAIFILATTELHKLPATIISRCQRFEFRRISTDALTDRIKYIAEQEDISIDDGAARLIARYAQGGMRDAISLLELCASAGRSIDIASVNETIGSAGRERMMDVVSAILNKDHDFLFSEIDAVVSSSKDITVFWQDLISLYRDLLVVKTVKESARYLDLTDFEAQRLTELASGFSRELIIYHCKMLEDALASMQSGGAIKRIIAELCFVKICDDRLSTSNEALLARITRLESRLAAGVAYAEPTVSTPTEKVPQQINAPEPTTTPTKAEPQKNATGMTGETRKHLKAWSEAVSTVRGLDISAYAFLKKTRAFIGGDGKIHVLTDTTYAIDRSEIKCALAAALTEQLGRMISESDIIYEKDDGTARADSTFIDDFDSFE